MASRKHVVVDRDSSVIVMNAVGNTPTVTVEFEGDYECSYRIDFDSRVILDSMDTEFWTNETVALKALDPNGVAYICDLGLYYHYNRQLVFTAFFEAARMKRFVQELQEAAKEVEKEFLDAKYTVEDFFADV